MPKLYQSMRNLCPKKKVCTTIKILSKTVLNCLGCQNNFIKKIPLYFIVLYPIIGLHQHKSLAWTLQTMIWFFLPITMPRLIQSNDFNLLSNVHFVVEFKQIINDSDTKFNASTSEYLVQACLLVHKRGVSIGSSANFSVLRRTEGMSVD